jgi:hypothetical protein
MRPAWTQGEREEPHRVALNVNPVAPLAQVDTTQQGTSRGSAWTARTPRPDPSAALPVGSIAVLRPYAYAGHMTFHGYVGVQARGVVALPADVRRRLHLDEQGAQVEIIEREDGVLELHPSLPVPANQRWFWTDRWQRREGEVDADVAAGRVSVHDDGDALLKHLTALESTDQP